jgi:hypothetical protein
VAAADFNSDGRTDLVGTFSLTVAVTVLLNSGAGAFGDVMPIPVGTAQNVRWAVLAAAFNRDGSPDVAVADSNTGAITVLLNSHSFDHPPAAGDVSVTTGEGTPVATLLAGSDPDGDPLTYTVLGGPGHGTLSGTGAGRTYTPDPNYFGPDSFTYRVSDGYDYSNIETVSINVIAPPTAANSSANVTVNVAQAITLSASDPNSPPRPLTYLITAGPTHGTLGVVSGNTVVYTPAADYVGPDSFQFKVNNGTGDSNVATVSLNVLQATETGISALWGSQSAALQIAGDGVRLLPAGRATDLPWGNLQGLGLTLSRAVTLNTGDVFVTGIIGGDYGPVAVSGSGTSYTLTLAKPIARADRLTLTLGNDQIVSFTRRLDVLPGDVNDDGVVNVADGVLILNNYTPAHAYSPFRDMNGDGSVSVSDFTLYRPYIGTTLPNLPPQLAAGGEGPGDVPQLTEQELGPVLAAAIGRCAAAGIPAQDVARLEGVTARVAALPAGYLGGAVLGGDVIYLPADAAGYGWSTDLSSVSAGREDQLTVVMHELGHTLGLGDFGPAQFPNDLMAETLATGIRRLPSLFDVMALGEPKSTLAALVAAATVDQGLHERGPAHASRLDVVSLVGALPFLPAPAAGISGEQNPSPSFPVGKTPAVTAVGTLVAARGDDPTPPTGWAWPVADGERNPWWKGFGEDSV